MSRFKNKTVLVTGGTSGIGLASVKRLVEEGARVIATGTNTERLDQISAFSKQVIAIQNDAAQKGAADDLAEQIEQKAGNIDAAFLNAGFGRMQPLGQYTEEEFDAQYHVNVRGPLMQAQAISDLLNANGNIVLNTSVARDMGLQNMAIYTSTKGAVRTLTRALAREYAERGIRVNAVSPGPIGSDFFNRAGLDEATQQEVGAAIQSQVPLGRFGTSEEVAAVALFLMSEDASFVTGSEYIVDGGMSEL